MNFSDEIIEICEHCHGIKECWCDAENKTYVKMEKWIYDLMKNLNPM